MNHQPVLFVGLDAVVGDVLLDGFEKIRWVPGVFSSLSRIRRDGPFAFVLCGRQPGVGTAALPREVFDPVWDRVLGTLRGEGIDFDDVVLDLSLPEDRAEGLASGLLDRFRSDGRYDMAASVMVGDPAVAARLGCRPLSVAGTGWPDIACLLLGDGRHAHRKASVRRTTKETDIALAVDLDGTGSGHVATGIGFFDHMLDQVLRHTGFDLDLHAHGDLEVDEHHTVEDVGIVLGEAVLQALGDKRGISRYGCELLPMDDVLAQVAIDFSGRPDFVWNVRFSREYVGTFPTEMVTHFFKSFSDAARCNLHMQVSDGNTHHQAEALFKAFSHAVRQAVRRYYWSDALPSTKGAL